MNGEPDGIIDTSTVVLLPRLASAADLPRHPTICTITLAELCVGPLATDDRVERAARLAQVQQAEADFDAPPFDAAVARAFGRVAADLRSSGRKPAARAFDALIAAVALANGLPLYTVNPKDFVGIDGIDLRTVAHPDTVKE